MTKQPTPEQLLDFVRRLAQMPTQDESMLSTFAPPDWEDISLWWRQYIDEARALTGTTYLEGIRK